MRRKIEGNGRGGRGREWNRGNLRLMGGRWGGGGVSGRGKEEGGESERTSDDDVRLLNLLLCHPFLVVEVEAAGWRRERSGREWVDFTQHPLHL